jgi:YfiH family protein
MIRPPGFGGAAFGAAAEGDGRSDHRLRGLMSDSLGIPDGWAVVRQVHGSRVLRVEGPGMAGEADAMFTTSPMLPLAVGTADCLPVVIEGEGGIGIAHAGWRGAAAGIVVGLRDALAAAGVSARRAAVGPGIGPCCFEVGAEVLEAFPAWVSSTSWGAPSVDLKSAVESSLEGLEVWRAPACTFCGSGFRSQRRDGGEARQVSLAWLT